MGHEKEFLHEEGDRALDWAAQECVESQSLEMFKRRADMAIRDMV